MNNNIKQYSKTSWKKLSKILVAIDGSSYSMDVAHHASMLSLQHETQQIVLHVLYPMEIHSSFQIYEFIQPIPIKEWIEIRKIDVQNWFDNIKKKIAEYSSSGGTNKKNRYEIWNYCIYFNGK